MLRALWLAMPRAPVYANELFLRRMERVLYYCIEVVVMKLQNVSRKHIHIKKYQARFLEYLVIPCNNFIFEF